MRRHATPAFAAAFAVVFVVGVVGAVAVTALNQVASPRSDDPTAPIGGMPSLSAPATDPSGAVDATRLPAETLPAVGGQAILRPDPTLTWESLNGALTWVEDQGLEMRSLQGFQRAGTVQPWTAEKADGSGTCILLRTHDGSIFDQLGCESDVAPASVERALAGSILRFTIDGAAIVVSVEAP
ncbi:hypothetical protein [Microbacterium sp. SS28]|uniref:hypothetical protein n=1 Tax=Microbacterium sp. SS28 TaxID=2919948 RepID=UPI001FAACA36|nr:hypothetical protein [Microbacterium sp. SS28]